MLMNQNLTNALSVAEVRCSFDLLIECVHGSHIVGAKQKNEFPLGNKLYFYTFPQISFIVGLLLHVHGGHENTL